MKKSASKAASSTITAPVKLGTKRSCLKCATKFYDFEKEEIVCPKCQATMSPADFENVLTVPKRREKPKIVEIQTEDAGTEDVAGSPFEDVGDLSDDDSDVSEDIEVVAIDEDKEDY